MNQPNKSHRYTTAGQRVDARGGVYWVPQDDVRRVVATRDDRPQILNEFRFIPIPEG